MICVVVALMLLSSVGCDRVSVSISTPKAAVSPIVLGSDLRAIDVCKAIPQGDIEAVMGRKLVNAPKSFQYYDSPGTSGCWYEGAKDPDKEAHFGYVVLTPLEVYNSQALVQKVDVAGIGEAAYLNNGADARQLWVKVNAKVAFVVAFGDRANEDGAKEIARLVVAAIK
ncbi:MAG TPA: hypothetical protein VLV54_17565 [Thermoanaerobaculia bacterium]|nr:hypothetical protein [Thermoanaerobaculia bacterium]